MKLQQTKAGEYENSYISLFNKIKQCLVLLLSYKYRL